MDKAGFKTFFKTWIHCWCTHRPQKMPWWATPWHWPTGPEFDTWFTPFCLNSLLLFTSIPVFCCFIYFLFFWLLLVASLSHLTPALTPYTWISGAELHFSKFSSTHLFSPQTSLENFFFGFLKFLQGRSNFLWKRWKHPCFKKIQQLFFLIIITNPWLWN